VIAGTAVGTWTAGKLALAGDLEVGDDVTLKSDAAVLNFGADSDVSLTHVADTGLLLNSTRQLQFNDSTQYIAGTSGTVLSIAATDEIDLTATAIDLNGTLDVSGTITVAGNADLNGDLDVDGTTNLDAVDIDGAVQIDSTVTVGTDGSGQDVIFYSDTAGDHVFWDSSAEKLTITGTNGATALDIADGNVTISDDLDVDGTSNLDVVDIDGAVDMASTLQVDGAITGSSTIQGTTITATTAFVPDASDGAALGTTSLEFSDLYLADGAVIGLGDDQDVTLTHVADTGLLLNSTMALQFNDASQYINAPSATVLDINATDEIELNATLVDLNGNLDVSGTTTMTGVATFTATPVFSSDLTIEDDLYLDSDAAVIHLGEDGDVTLTHVADTGVLLNGTMQLQFNDSSQYINAPSNAILDINATDEIELNATLADVNANLDVSGTIVGASTISGTTITASTAFVPDASDGAALGTTSLEFSDLFLADGAQIAFGDDQEVTLTHVADTGLLLSDDSGIGTTQLQFGDSGTYIHQSADGVLDLVADTEIEINATTIDVNGALDVSGTSTLTGAVTATAGVLPAASDGAALGSASLEWSDLFLADGAVINFGDDQDVTLTHVADTGLLLNTTMQLQFYDSSQFINAPSNAILDITATDEIELNATAIDLNGTLDVSGTLTLAGNADFNGDLDVDGTTNLDVVDIDGAVDMASTLGVTGVVTANAGVVVDNITIDGTEIDLSSGDLTLDVAGDINLDAAGGNFLFQQAGTTFFDIQFDSSDAQLISRVQDKDIIFRGNDGGSIINALTLDMSGGGWGVFNTGITCKDGIYINNADGSATVGYLYNDSNDFIIRSYNSDNDIIFKGNDGGSTITALTLDMSDAGTATFNNNLVASGTGPHAIGASVNAGMKVNLGGAFTGGSTTPHSLRVDGRLTSPSSTSVVYQSYFANALTTDASSHTVTTIAQVAINECDITLGSGSSATNSASLYIASAASEATNNYALWVDAGDTRLDGDATVGGNLTIGDGGAEDQKIVFDGNAVDFYMGLDDTDDDFKIGVGSTVGSGELGFFMQADTGHVNIGSDNFAGYQLTVQGDDEEVTANFGSALSSTGDWNGIGFGAMTQPKAGILFKRTSSYGVGDLYFCNNNEASTTHVSLADTSDYAMRVGSNRVVQFYEDVLVTATKKLYFDSGSDTYIQGEVVGNQLDFYTSGVLAIQIDGNGNVAIPNGALSKESGSFKIDHPLPDKKDTHHLVHSFIEGPKADLIYRGSTDLISGWAQVDLDDAAGMTEGTWELLCRDPQCWIQNDTGWSSVRGSVEGNTLTVECESTDSDDTVSWMVVAERCDPHMYDTGWTDDDGRVIVEPEKPEPEEEE
jgi:hypothetical protein